MVKDGYVVAGNLRSREPRPDQLRFLIRYTIWMANGLLGSSLRFTVDLSSPFASKLDRLYRRHGATLTQLQYEITRK